MTPGGRRDLRIRRRVALKGLSEIEAAAWVRPKAVHSAAGDSRTVLAKSTLS
jgi:hypothetical protein